MTQGLLEDYRRRLFIFGRCMINYKGTYAFAEFDNEKDAEEAMNHLQKKNMGGRELNIE